MIEVPLIQMNGRTLLAGVSSIAAIAFTLILTTTNLRADPTAAVDEVSQLRNRVAALEAEVKALRAEMKALKAEKMPSFDAFKLNDKDFKLDGKSEVRVNINGKEYILPRDKEKLQKEQPNLKFGAGSFGFGLDGDSLKFTMPDMKFEGKDGKVYILPRDLDKLKSDPDFKAHHFDGKPFEMSKELQEAMRKAMEELREGLKNLPDARSEMERGVAPTSI